MLRDLGTQNGTFVNNERNTGWTAVHHGDSIRLGHTLFQFEDVAEPAPGKSAIQPLPDLVDIPGYRVYDKIGDGATGTVYRGLQLSLDRAVAIKVLSPALAKQSSYVDRFVREARAAAELSHPHVIPVYSVGQTNGLYYFTMELMEQGTVEDRLLDAPGSRLPWPEAVGLISDAAAGLAHIHQHGLVHRDIKPANLLLDADDCVKLGDLGTLVREADAQGVRIGTPHFMSPEQARRERVTRASDVYSLGATLYRMLTGGTPHQGEGLREIVRAVAHDTPHPIEALREGLPQVVADEINGMMSRDPAARPVDAAEVGERLAAAVSDVHDDRRSRRRDRRRKATSQEVMLRIALLALVGGALFALREPIRVGLAELWTRVKSSVQAPPPPAPAVDPDRDAPTRPSLPPRPPPPDAPTAAEILARYAPIRALDDARPPLAAGDAAAAATWRGIAQEYEDFVGHHPLESEQVLTAHRRAQSIRHELAAVVPIDPAVAAAVDRRLAAEFEAAGAGALTTGLPEVPSLRVIRGGQPDRVRDSRTDTLLAARQDLGEGRGVPVREVFARVIEWVRVERGQARDGPDAERTLSTIDGAVDWLRHTGRIVDTRLAARIEGDERLLARHMRGTGFFSGLDGLADPALALARLDRLESYMSMELGRERCRARRRRLTQERGTWSQEISSGASPEAVADALVGRSGTLAREHLEGALWLLLETGRRYRAEEILTERRLPDGPSAAVIRSQLDALRDLATMGESPRAAQVIAWSKQYPRVDLVLAGAAADVEGFAVFSNQDRKACHERWGAAPPR